MVAQTNFLASKHDKPAKAEKTTEPDNENKSDAPLKDSASDVPDGSVKDVLGWVDGNPERAQAALDQEKDGKNRTTLVAELETLAATEPDNEDDADK